ncbi:IPPK kinase, partial [Polypterus senegalus]
MALAFLNGQCAGHCWGFFILDDMVEEGGEVQYAPAAKDLPRSGGDVIGAGCFPIFHVLDGGFNFHVHQYRVAMTAKDCSIMIAFSPCAEDELPDSHLVIPSSKSRFTYSVSILDLDPKPYENIPHQYKLDGKIVNYYLKKTLGKQEHEHEDCTLVLHSV